MIQRLLQRNILKRLGQNKVIILLGARQVGKTTLLKELKKSIPGKVLSWNADESDIRARLKNPTSTRLKAEIGQPDFLFIDEAQRIENIGLVLKLLIDNFPEIQIIATGSSSFDLGNKINEPLTGRKWEFQLFPLSTAEMREHHSRIEEERLLNKRLVFGFYPDVVNNQGDEIPILKTLAESYLYKDILMLEDIRKPEKLEKMIQGIAFQVGNQVSYHELAQFSGLDPHTVEKYIQLLEKAFVIFRLQSFSRNLRNEIKKSRKIYFYDNGIRNALINQFNPIDLRADTGALWENFLVGERMKKLHYDQIYCSRYFWRTHAQQEIDYIEERDGTISAYEFKFNPVRKVKFSKTFINEYKPEIIEVVNPENYLSFVG